MFICLFTLCRIPASSALDATRACSATLVPPVDKSFRLTAGWGSACCYVVGMQKSPICSDATCWRISLFALRVWASPVSIWSGQERICILKFINCINAFLNPKCFQLRPQQSDQWIDWQTCKALFDKDACNSVSDPDVASRGVMRLDGARGKKQVWRPHIRTWGLS